MPNRDIDGDTEGFGIVYLEANACGKPAIAGRAGGTGSAVSDGDNGLQVNGNDPQAVEAGIASLLLDTVLYQRICRAARQRIVNGFTPHRRVELIRRVIMGDTPSTV